MASETAARARPDQEVRARAVELSTVWRGSLLLLSLLAFATRLHSLGGDSFWMDELLTLRDVQNSSNLLTAVRDHPPLLYTLVRLSLQALGESEFAARLPSALAGTLTIPMLAVFGKVARRPWAGLWAATLLLLSPFHLRYAQEARHYALLLLFTLASFVWLLRGLQARALQGQRRPEFAFVAYGIALALALYTHYGAFLVLFAQALVLGGWTVTGLARGQWQRLRYAATAAGVTLLLYLPWAGRSLDAFLLNRGEEAAVGTTGIAPLSDWLQNAFDAFGFETGIMPFLLLGLALLGGALLVRQRAWLLLGLLLSALTVPFILIAQFEVARWALPKYIIYLLPLYLFLAGCGLDGLLRWGAERLRAERVSYPTLALPALALLSMALGPGLRAEYRRMERDWRGVAQFLAQEAAPGPLLVGFNMDLPDAFDQIGVSLPYYLDDQPEEYRLLGAGSLDVGEPDGLPQAEVWGILFNRVVPVVLPEAGAEVTAFQGSVYVVRLQQGAQAADDRLRALYETVVPLAVAPAPRCLFQRDMAALALASGAYAEAEAYYEEATSQCPGTAADFELAQGIYRALLQQHLAQAEQEAAYRAAQQLLALDAKDEEALSLLTWANLLDRFERGERTVALPAAPAEVGVKRYTMPQNGDWGDVLFIHPPASVSFPLSLPETPLRLQSRLALAPESWEWGGDGATFVVEIEGADGERSELFRSHLSNDPQARRWHPLDLSLAAYAGQDVVLTLRTESGPAGDSSGDWAGWEMPRLLWDDAAGLARQTN